MDVEEGVPSTAIREVSVTSIGNLPCRSIRYSSNLANSSPKENATTFFFLLSTLLLPASLVRNRKAEHMRL